MAARSAIEVLASIGPPIGGTPTVDAHANSGNNWHSSASGSVTISTTHAGDAILLHIGSENTAATVSSVSSTNTTGWVQLASNNYNVSRPVNQAVWLGFASGVLTNESITVTMSQGIDGGILQAIAINSAGTAYTSQSNTMDGNSSLPGKANNQSATTTPQVTGLSTNNAVAMVFGFYATSFGTDPETAGTGFSILDRDGNGFGVHNMIGSVENESITSALSNATVGFGLTSGDWGVIVVAVKRAGAPG